MTSKRYGLIGERLGHSHSPMLHALLASYDYRLYELAPDAVAAFVRGPDIGGLNVTIPYKQLAAGLCDVVSERAARTGSVNTLVPLADGRLMGDNTDYDGFAALARRAGIGFAGRKVVMLGNGGTAQTVRQVALDAGARQVVTISRRGPVGYDRLGEHADADILVNTTPVGMFPDTEGMPVLLDGFDRLQGVLDVIYNPLRTRLVLAARARGIPAAGGLPMLVWQAAGAVGLFTGEAVPAQRTEAALDSLRRSVESIVLVGMPGCGKTTVGRAVAALAGRPFLDTDEMLAERWGRPVREVLVEKGEAYFRDAEQAVVAEAARQSGHVIATGGGSILRAENRLMLRQNSRVFHLRRPLPLLAAEGRPLSSDLERLAQVRMPLYAEAADAAIDNEGKIEAAALRIWEAF